MAERALDFVSAAGDLVAVSGGFEVGLRWFPVLMSRGCAAGGNDALDGSMPLDIGDDEEVGGLEGACVSDLACREFDSVSFAR